MTLEQVDRALRELTNGEVNKLAAGDEAEGLALNALKRASMGKGIKRGVAADSLLDWVVLAGCTSGRQARAFAIYALAGYSSIPEVEARLREDVARYEPDLRALADS